MIKKEGNKYLVKDSSGKKTLGTHPSKERALAQLRAIEASKAKRVALQKLKDGGTTSCK